MTLLILHRRLLLGAPPWLTDPDARDFIQRVEAADGAALEDGIKLAYADFIRGCKADNIWNAIKASCILAGARTLSGALVPLVGTAPTNFNFVSGDYNRKTGLVGNGSTKYLDANILHNHTAATNRHFSVFANQFSTPSSLLATNNTSNADDITITTIRCTSNSSTVVPHGLVAPGFAGGNRSAADHFLARGNSNTVQHNITAGAVTTAPYNLYRLPTGIYYSNARLAFYSIGESLDLALLDARVTTLINAFAAAIP